MTVKRRTFPKDVGERVSLQARTTARTRDRLQEAANASGRSLSQEMEMRLEQSLGTEDAASITGRKVIEYLGERDVIFHAMLEGKETFDFLLDIAFLISGVQAGKKEKWFENPELRAEVYQTIDAALPELVRAQRTGDIAGPFMRAVEYAKYLPKRETKPKAETGQSLRFMSDEERKRFFYPSDDNA